MNTWRVAPLLVAFLALAPVVHAAPSEMDGARAESTAPAIDVSIGGGVVSASLDPFEDQLRAMCDCDVRPTGRVGLHGGYAQIEAQGKLTSWLAGAVILRPGAFRWSGTVTPPYPLTNPSSASALDPQLGDQAGAFAFAAMLRFLPGRFAIDVGFTQASGSMRARDRIDLSMKVPSDWANQSAFEGRAFTPTIRASYQSGGGFFVGAGWGEGFVRMPQAGGQIALGYRGPNAEALFSASKLYDFWYGGRVAVRVFERWWVAVDAQVADNGCPSSGTHACDLGVAASASIAWRGLGLAL
jgi:hypothetical protein